MISTAVDYAKTILFGPSAYQANVELQYRVGKSSSNHRITNISTSPDTAALVIDGHVGAHSKRTTISRRAKFWLDLNDDFGPLTLPKELRSAVMAELRANPNRNTNKSFVKYWSTYLQTYGIPKPLPHFVFNAAMFGATGGLIDYTVANPIPVGGFAGVALFYSGKMLFNLMQPEVSYGLSAHYYEINIRRSSIFKN